MRIVLYNDKHEKVREYTIRSDFEFHGLDKDHLWELINQYIRPESNYVITIDGITHPNDPNTKEGRDKMMKQFDLHD